MPVENESSLLNKSMKQKPKARWTEEEILILRSNWKTMIASQIQLLIPRHSADAVRRKMKRIGIDLSEQDRSWRSQYARNFVDNDNICKVDQSINLNDLNNDVTQLLLGSMLGDGCSTKQSSNLRNFRFVEGHCLKQSNYLKWKGKILSIFKPRIAVRQNKIDLVTKIHPIFTLFRSKFYPSMDKCTKSILPLDLLEKLDLFGFMVWYLDDGSLGKKSWNLNIGAKGWNETGLLKFVEMLNAKFGISTYVYKCRHYQGENKVVKIPFKNKDILDKWLSLAKQHNLPKCMFYKLISSK